MTDGSAAMTDGSAAADKAALRRSVTARLLALSPEQRAVRSRQLRLKLTPLLESAAQLRVALYAALPHEVDLLPLLTEHPGHDYYFPRCLPGHRLSFHLVRSPERELSPGAMGIATPSAELPSLAPEHFDIVIVPGLAFSLEGDRLGYGGGYYDRFLPLCSGARLVALAFREQILPAIPREAHDLRIPQLIHL